MTTANPSTDPRPIGPVVENWTLPVVPSGNILLGRTVRLEPLCADKHSDGLFKAFKGHDHVWDYMFDGPFKSVDDFHAWVDRIVAGRGQFFYVIQDLETTDYVGITSYLRIDPSSGSIEVGNISFAPVLQRTVAATEAMYLMMEWAFEAGYRRYEWKCNALNAPSRRAAQRLGFSYEGIFRQATISKGRNRDTAWFAAIDAEWPALKQAFQTWLSPLNFDAQGRQKQSLGDLTGPLRAASDPTL